jgi:hypothetical protein
MFPLVEREDGVFHHQFHIPGIGFHLFLGSAVPKRFSKLCLVNSPLHLIYGSDIIDRMALRDMAALMPR